MCVCMYAYVYVCANVCMCVSLLSRPVSLLSRPVSLRSRPVSLLSRPVSYIYIYVSLLQFMTMTLPNFLHAVSGRKPL